MLRCQVKEVHCVIGQWQGRRRHPRKQTNQVWRAWNLCAETIISERTENTSHLLWGHPCLKGSHVCPLSKYREREPFVLYSLSYSYFFFSPFCISTLIATHLARSPHRICQNKKGKEPWPPECNGWKPGSQTDQEFQSLAFHTELAITRSFNKCH